MGDRLISDNDIKIIKDNYWSRLTNAVKLVYINKRGECQYCKTISQLYKEISGITDKISLEELYIEDLPKDFIEEYNIIEAPVVIIKGRNKGLIKFYGIPSGMEFPSFIESIVKISNGEVDLPDEVISKVKSIDMKVNIKIFVTPSCPYCPKMVSTGFMFSILNENIEVEAFESIEFPDIAEKYDVHAVPKIVINDKVSWEGMVPPDYFLENILQALEK